jgi:cytochrome c nitrite reductase small subunit
MAHLKRLSKQRRDRILFMGSTTFFLCVAPAILIGATTEVGTYTFGYAGGASYLKDDAQSCANCDVMQQHLDAWVKSSHGKFAPHDDFAAK